MRYFLSVIAFLSGWTCTCLGADWTQWGGGNERNMVSSEKGLPESFEPGETKSGGSDIDMATTSPQGIAESVAFLCSESGDFLSGAVLPYMHR